MNVFFAAKVRYNVLISEGDDFVNWDREYLYARLDSKNSKNVQCSMLNIQCSIAHSALRKS
jgi:hypothetical protein